MSLGYISGLIHDDRLSTTVEENKEIDLRIILENHGTEPAYGMTLEILSTVSLSNIPSFCRMKHSVSFSQ